MDESIPDMQGTNVLQLFDSFDRGFVRSIEGCQICDLRNFGTKKILNLWATLPLRDQDEIII